MAEIKAKFNHKIAPQLSTPAMLYLGTTNGIIALANTNQHWQPTQFGLTGKNVMGLGYSQNNLTAFYAAVSGYGLFQTEDAGLTWQQRLATNASCLLIDQADDRQIWVGAEPATVHRSLDGGQTWQNLEERLQQLPVSLDWYAPDPPYQARLRTLAQVPANDQSQHLVAGIEVGHLIYSPNRGDTWFVAGGDVEAAIQTLAVHPTIIGFCLAATDEGIYRSLDGGKSWQEASPGLRHLNITTLMITQSGLCLAAGTGTPPGPWVENAVSTLYYSSDNAETWQEIYLDPAIYITAFVEATAGELYLGSQGGGIYRSCNQGEIWEKIVQLSTRINTIIAKN